MRRIRLGIPVCFGTALLMVLAAARADAAAEVHRLNLVISAIPSSINGGGFNETIDFINRTGLRPFGLETLRQIEFAWTYDLELRYLIRPNLALTAGVGHIRGQSKREFLPAIRTNIDLRTEVRSIPIHLGGAYYFQPYNQGDFQARAYLGGGVLHLVDNKALYQQTTNLPDSLGVPNVTSRFTNDAPGFYVDGGVHMFFALRYSVLLGVLYRNAEIKNLRDRDTGVLVYAPNGKPMSLDVGGVGAKLALAYGF